MNKIDLNNNVLVEVCQLSKTHCIAIAIFDSIYQAMQFAESISEKKIELDPGTPRGIHGIFEMKNHDHIIVMDRKDIAIFKTLAEGNETGTIEAYSDYLLGPLDPRD